MTNVETENASSTLLLRKLFQRLSQAGSDALRNSPDLALRLQSGDITLLVAVVE